ncbi:hypothetical protein BC830DRAFT_1134195 [Chytriomyces sp. MP71]|nr:hypothetical protein BC830DRAFT_1134195 [Chytriomyces sp. MP71]
MEFASFEQAVEQLRRTLVPHHPPNPVAAFVAALCEALCKRSAAPSSVGFALTASNAWFVLFGLAQSASAQDQVAAVARVLAGFAENAEQWKVSEQDALQMCCKCVDKMLDPKPSQNEHNPVSPANWKSLASLAPQINTLCLKAGFSSSPLVSVFTDHASTYIQLLATSAPSRVLPVAKMTLVHINSVYAVCLPSLCLGEVTDALVQDSTTFLLAVCATLFQSNLQTDPAFPALHYGLQATLYTLTEKNPPAPDRRHAFISALLHSRDATQCEAQVAAECYLAALLIATGPRDVSKYLRAFLTSLESAPVHVPMHCGIQGVVGSLGVLVSASVVQCVRASIARDSEGGMEWMRVEEVLFEALCCGSVRTVLCALDVLGVLLEDLSGEVCGRRWIVALGGVLERVRLDPLIAAAVGAFLERLVLRFGHTIESGALEAWTVFPGTLSHVVSEAVLGLWNTFLTLLDAEDADPDSSHLMAFEKALQCLRAGLRGLGEDIVRDGVCEPVAFLVEAMKDAVGAVVKGPGEYVNMYRTVRSLLEVVHEMRGIFTVEVRGRLVEVIEGWSRQQDVLMPQEDSIQLCRALRAVK